MIYDFEWFHGFVPHIHNKFIILVSREGLEPSTPALKGRCSTG
jgi:hypothetical protein